MDKPIFDCMKRVLLVLVTMVFALASYAQAPKYSNEFLAIGVGARSLGMANSQILVLKKQKTKELKWMVWIGFDLNLLNVN